MKDEVGIGIAKDNPEVLASLNAAIASWKKDQSGFLASIKAANADSSPLQFAVGTVPTWAKDISKEQFGV